MPRDVRLADLPLFDGATFEAELDGARLGAQLAAVRACMRDGQWRTLAEIAAVTGAPEASVSARLRDLRKPKHGAYAVERRRAAAGRGLHVYRVLEAEDRLADLSA